MKTILAFVLCSIFLIAANYQKFADISKTFNKNGIYTHTLNSEFTDTQTTGRNSTLSCNGNGTVTFVNTSSQPLWFYYWYVEDVRDASNECQFRRFWKQLDAGNNMFTIPKNKTLVFRICTSSQCANSLIKQYGIVYYCNVNNGIVTVK